MSVTNYRDHCKAKVTQNRQVNTMHDTCQLKSEHLMTHDALRFSLIYLVGTGIVLCMMIPAALISFSAIVLGTVFNIGVVYAATMRVYRKFVLTNHRFLTVNEHASVINKSFGLAVLGSVLLLIGMIILSNLYGQQYVTDTAIYSGLGSLHTGEVIIGVIVSQLITWAVIPAGYRNAGCYLAKKCKEEPEN